jgi:hypothetical protein
LRVFLTFLGGPARVAECRLEDLVFLDHRPADLSLNPQKVLAATGLTFRSVRSCCDEMARNAKRLEVGVGG